MNPRFEAAWEMHEFLTEHNISYAIIGGTALPRWGEPRFTKDVDLVVVTSLEEGVAPFVRLVLTRFASREEDAITFARENRVIKLTATNHCEVDVSLGMPGYEAEMLRRAVEYELKKGKSVRICSAEDLIILKCVAGRPQDLIDVEGVIARQTRMLDVRYVREWLARFDELLPEPHARDDFERAWRAERRAASKPARKPAKRVTRKR